MLPVVSMNSITFHLPCLLEARPSDALFILERSEEGPKVEGPNEDRNGV